MLQGDEHDCWHPLIGEAEYCNALAWNDIEGHCQDSGMTKTLCWEVVAA